MATYGEGILFWRGAVGIDFHINTLPSNHEVWTNSPHLSPWKLIVILKHFLVYKSLWNYKDLSNLFIKDRQFLQDKFPRKKYLVHNK